MDDRLNIKEQNELQNLLKLNIPHDLALMKVYSAREDKTMFHKCFQFIKQDNDILERELIEKGFEKAEFN